MSNVQSKSKKVRDGDDFVKFAVWPESGDSQDLTRGVSVKEKKIDSPCASDGGDLSTFFSSHPTNVFLFFKPQQQHHRSIFSGRRSSSAKTQTIDHGELCSRHHWSG